MFREWIEPGTFWGGGTDPNYYYGALFYSEDYGLNWNQILTVGPLVQCMNIDEIEGNFYAGTTDGGIYRSTDWGSNWRTFNIGLLNSSVESIEINSIGYIFIGTHSGIFRINR